MRPHDWILCARDHADELPPGARHALLVLATYADENGRCYPSMRRLGAIMGVSKSAAQRRIEVLVALDWLLVEHVGRYVGDPNRYRITPTGCPHAARRNRPAGGTVREADDRYDRPATGTVSGTASDEEAVDDRPATAQSRPATAQSRPAGATRTYKKVQEPAAESTSAGALSGARPRGLRPNETSGRGERGTLKRSETCARCPGRIPAGAEALMVANGRYVHLRCPIDAGELGRGNGAGVARPRHRDAVEVSPR
jgi:hypothetical protein